MSPLKVALRADDILADPRFNKGTAFTRAERSRFKLTSRLPYEVNDLDTQCYRAWDQLQANEDALKKNQFLWSLKEQNIVLFYALLSRHLTELFPIIYTPTEAEAISSYSHVFRRPSGGVFLSYPERETLEDDLKSHLVDSKGRKKEYDLVVVSDGEAILGIGDQGSGGIGISTAKAVIYSLVAGVDPSRTLSVVLDVGTDRQELRDDPIYVGWKHERVRGKKYDDFVDRFVSVVADSLGAGTLLHFEDFGVANAQRILERYRVKHPLFNDDIQGTGAVTLAAITAALKVTRSDLTEQRIVIFGAGSAGLGIAKQLRQAMTQSTAGSTTISANEANARFWLVDRDGLITDKTEGVREALGDFRRKDWDAQGVQLLDVVRKVKPTIMIGTSTQGGAWTEEIVKEMVKHVERPILLPLSNPTKLHEVTPENALKWTNGKALLATGSPFDPVDTPDGKYIVAECNNALVYPGLGFGAILAQARTVSDTMIVAASKRLAELAPANADDPRAALLPDFKDSRAVNLEIALAVMAQAIDEGNANVDVEPEKRREYAEGKQWKPEYVEFEYDPEGLD
ncbi:NAD-dependent malic enzyme, mitochondrial [Cryptotrichosporon argae]